MAAGEAGSKKLFDKLSLFFLYRIITLPFSTLTTLVVYLIS